MTREEAIAQLKDNRVLCVDSETEPFAIAYDMAIKALEQEPCEDCISRADALSDKGLGVFHYYEDYARMRNYLKNLPPVTPKPETVTEFADRCKECGAKHNELLKEKTAHWIRWYEEIKHDKYVEHVPYCKCSECGKEYNPYSSQFIKYCSNCGRKMVEQQEWPLPEYKESEENAKKSM